MSCFLSVTNIYIGPYRSAFSVDGAQQKTHKNRLRSRTSSFTFSILSIIIIFFFVVLLFRCNSRRFLLQDGRRERSFFLYPFDKLLLGYIFHPPVLVVFL